MGVLYLFLAKHFLADGASQLTKYPISCGFTVLLAAFLGCGVVHRFALFVFVSKWY